MSSARDQVVSEFLEIYLDDDQLWAAGGAAEIQQLLHQNIDDRGRMNGKVILNFLVTRGVPMPAARAAMDKFVAKRRASLAAQRGHSGGNAPAPRASGIARASAAPSAGGAGPSPRPHARGIGVTSATAVRERSPTAMPSAPAPSAKGSSTLPWGAEMAEPPDTDAHGMGAYDEEATQISDAFSGERTGSQPSTSQPPRAMTPSSPGPRAPTAIRGGLPRQPAASLDPPAATAPAADPPPLVLDPSALTEITAPSQTTPTPSGEPRKRSASEIRGAPIAAAAAATSGPTARAPSTPPTPSGPPSAFGSPPSVFASGPPAALAGAAPSDRAAKRAQRKAERAGKKALSGDMADALGITARKEAEAEEARQQAIKQDHTLARQERNPEEEKGPVHPGVALAAAGLIGVVLGVVWFVTRPAPPEVVFAASDKALPCMTPTAHGGELFCRLPQAEVQHPPAQLRAKLNASRAEAKTAGYQGVWFFIEETGRPWVVPHALWDVGPQVAARSADAAKGSDGKQLPTKTDAATEEVDDIVDGLTAPPPPPPAAESAGADALNEVDEIDEVDEVDEASAPQEPKTTETKKSKKKTKKKRNKRKRRRKRR